MKYVWRTLLIVLGLVLLIAWYTDEDTFTPPRLAGPPLLATEGETPRLLLLTTHLEIAAILPNVLGEQPRERTHIDLWAFSGSDFSPLWVRRVASVPYHARLPDPRLTGVQDGTIWLTAADRTHAFALSDGTPSPNGPAPPATTTQRPMALRHVYEGDAAFRARGVVIDATWFGMARAEDAAILPRDPTRNLDARDDYQLWTASAVGTMAPSLRRMTWDYRDFTPVVASPVFQYGGLLAQATDAARPVIFLPNPRRFLVLHDLPDTELLRRGLTCLRPDGTVCWAAKLGVTQIQGVAPLRSALPDEHALIIAGVVKRPRDSEHDAAQAILRVAMADGALQVINVGDIDPRALKRSLAQ